MNVKFRVVSATRRTREEFFAATALGRSLALYPFVELRLFPSNSLGLPTIYNTALREAEHDPAILVFIHDDVYLSDFFWHKHLFDGLRVFDIVGVIGNKRRVPNQCSWLCIDDKLTWDAMDNLSGVIAHGTGFPPQRYEWFGPPCQEVKLLDGLMLAARSETLLSSKVGFDERFDFHFYDMDFCRQAENRCLRMGTWNLSLIHESRGNAGDPSWREQYQKYLSKWKS
jgi:hypothetical protein